MSLKLTATAWLVLSRGLTAFLYGEEVYAGLQFTMNEALKRPVGWWLAELCHAGTVEKASLRRNCLRWLVISSCISERGVNASVVGKRYQTCEFLTGLELWKTNEALKDNRFFLFMVIVLGG